MKTKYIYLLSILIVLVSGIAMAIPENKIPEQKEKTLDDKLLVVAAKTPGFGGMYADGDVLKVYLLNPSQKSSAEVTIASVFGRERSKNIQILQGKYSFSQLKEWHNLAGALFGMEKTIYTDIDDKQNRLKIGVDDSDFKEIEKKLDQLGIPRDAVIIEKTDPIVYVSTLRDRIRPIQGGLQIAFSFYACSEGFNGNRGGVAGFVTASHCTNRQGGVENTQHYQPTVADNLIGTEIADPYYTKAKCLARGIRGRVCRYSDSAYSSLASGVTEDLGLIEMPDSTNTNSLTIADSFRITSEGSSITGNQVNKVGRTTGWTQGSVTNTCVNVGVSGTNIVQLCQDLVNANVAGGDSGSPVFSITNNPQANDIELRGILWGGNLAGTMFVYSPITNIQRSDELGPITTCYPGFGC